MDILVAIHYALVLVNILVGLIGLASFFLICTFLVLTATVVWRKITDINGKQRKE